MIKNLNQSHLAVTHACFWVLLWLSAMALHANPEEKIEDDVWTSVDGRNLQAQGVAWTPRGVLVKKQGMNNTMLVPYESLQADDVNRAVSSLPFDRKEDITLKVPVAKKIQKKEKSSVTTVKKFAIVPLESGADTAVFKTRTKHTYENKVGYNLEVQLKLNSDPCTVWVEVYGLYRGEDKKIYCIHQEKQKVGIGAEVAICQFTCPPEQSRIGWVVLCRSIQSGKIVAMASSDWQHDGIAREQLKDTHHWVDVQNSNELNLNPIKMKSPDEYREKILEDLKLRKDG